MKHKYNVGIIGFGLSGRYFFSPFIDKHPDFNLYGIVSSQHQLVKQEYPQVKVCHKAEEILNDPEVDLIIVASPNITHFDYAKQALIAGKHVIVEKPFTITSSEAEELIRLSGKNNCAVVPFQNRRWDGDFLTVKKIIEEGSLGQLLEFESHFDRYRPLYERVPWKNLPDQGNGILYDLGPHLIDQALSLFGFPTSIYADIRTQRLDSKIDDYFELHLYYPELKVILKASAFVREPGPRFILHGRKGSFIKYGLDPQEEHLKHGLKPGDKGYGQEDPANFGTLHTEMNGEKMRKKVESINGNYMDYFENVYHSIANAATLMVKPGDGLNTIRIIEKAYQSNREKRVVLI
jgi:scyllo-inositol 2-dehydrogenase (NADP+)